MKLIIAGSRTLKPSFGFIRSAMEMLWVSKHGPITEIVSGCAEGVDSEGEHWASHYERQVIRFPADWKKHGRAAGPIRNKQMADYADALLLIWDGQSRGSSNMKQEMLKLKKPVYEVVLRNENEVL